VKNFIEEFKEFASQGNVMDMAVGVIIATAFTAIVTSLVNDIVMPIIAVVCGGMDYQSITIPLGSTGNAITLGNFISAIINFLLIALVLFFMIKAITKAQKVTGTASDDETPTCPFCQEEVSADATRCPHCTSEISAANEA